MLARPGRCTIVSGGPTRLRAVLAGFLVIALAAPALAQNPSAAWEQAMESGRKAYEQGRYEDAEKHLKTALQEAESFEPRDPRLAATLEQVITVYRTQGKIILADPPLPPAARHPGRHLGAGWTSAWFRL